MSLFIQCENQIVNREQICGAEFKKFDAKDAEILGASSILIIYTADGNCIKFKNAAADVMWTMLCDAAIDLTPVEEEEQS